MQKGGKFTCIGFLADLFASLSMGDIVFSLVDCKIGFGEDSIGKSLNRSTPFRTLAEAVFGASAGVSSKAEFNDASEGACGSLLL